MSRSTSTTSEDEEGDEDEDITEPNYRITRSSEKKHTGLRRKQRSDTPYEAPPLKLLQQQPRSNRSRRVSDEVLQENARELEGVLQDFGVKGEITNVRPGPVVTLYELEPAPGTKSSRVIGLSDDIARSMSAVATRVAVVPGRNAIGIELPNDRREIVDAAGAPRISATSRRPTRGSRSRSARISAASRSPSISPACRIS